MKKITILSILLCIFSLTGCQNMETESGTISHEQERLEENIAEEKDNSDAGNEKIDETVSQDIAIIKAKGQEDDKSAQLNVSMDITELYVTHKGDPSNLYHIDENNVLWGCGRNNYGQLGQGTQDYDFHEDMVKIAENAIHVDYSQRGFVIFLTEDYKLYGMGNSGRGALHVYNEIDWTQPANGEHYTVTEPILLMTGVIYACCGRDDIVCLEEDGTVWTWGTIYDGYFIANPTKLFEKAVMVTGGWYNHAVLLPNGTVWTWGYNGAGNCGVADCSIVSVPTMVAEDVVMVQTNISLDSYPQPKADDIGKAWTGSLKYTEHDSIAEYYAYPKYFNNTVIQKSDGSYWVCGENVGTEKKMVSGEEGDYSAICTHEFYPCE